MNVGSAHQRLIVGCRWWVGLPRLLWTSVAVVKDLRNPFSPARRASNSPSPRFAVAVGVAAVGHAGAARMCRSCRSSACHLYLEVCVRVGLGVKGLSLCWYVKVTCLHSRAPQAHLLVACWCSQRGLHRTICHPAAVMITSVLPCRPLSLLWSHHSLLPPAGCVTLC